LIGELRRTIEIFLAEMVAFKFSGLTFLGEVQFPVKAGFQARFSMFLFLVLF